MHDDADLILSRLSRVLRDRLVPARERVLARLTVDAWHVWEPVPPEQALAAEYAPFEVGDAWGAAWDTTWFRLTGTVPPHPVTGRIELAVDLGWRTDLSGFQAEGLVYTRNGRAVKGLNPLNQWIPIGTTELEFYVEAAANPIVLDLTHAPFAPTPLGERTTAGSEPLYRLARADIVQIDEPVEQLVADLEFLGELASALDEASTRRWHILRAIGRCLDALDPDDVSGSTPAARAELVPALTAGATASAQRVSAVGHAHIDSAWLWPTRETVRKVARTAANQLALMEEDPTLVFAMSSAQQWDWLRQDRNELYERLRERVTEGRVVPVGGMWVESDVVLTGGEALVRQFLEGGRFFREELGIRSRVVWLPDSFGYSGALPQIVRLAGYEGFLTQKISWNRTNRFPHHSFEWVGIDGTSVFTHFPPADTYNGVLTPGELIRAQDAFREKGAASRQLLPFGLGDGGGGPTRQMLQRARRARDAEGLPRVEIESPEDFFRCAQAELPTPPRWHGELYLELHRGTLTSQAAMKRGNRRSEHLLREAELWCTTAAVRGVAEYPRERLRELWRRVLLYQFHDILPGSSIGWVHREASADYQRISDELEAISDAARAALTGPGDAPLAFNPRPHPVLGIPAGGAGTPASVAPSASVVAVAEGGWLLRTAELSVRLDAAGTIVSVRRPDGAEAIAPGGRAGLLQLHDDKPAAWDAWDLDDYYRNRTADIDDVAAVELEGGTPHSPAETAAVRIRRRFGASEAEQIVRVHSGAGSVEVTTTIDWREREKVLKLAFPVDVHAQSARFETQFGHVTRAIHENTSWDAARFEVAAHRWVHVGEPRGVALANDTTYGHDVRTVPRRGGGLASVIRATLLRAPRYPDPETDQGRHTFRHVLVPDASVADAVTAGYDLNLPLRWRAGGRGVEPVVQVDGDRTVRIEAVKLADDGSGDVVVRLYESEGTGGRAALHSPDAGRLIEVGLLEEPLEEIPFRRDPVLDEDGTVTLRPFQLVTLRLLRG
ncbi:glycoside hydrolase family 38 C-terminal domain-containing protein [Microbacterium neimengense]